ncbi:hypothetical protein FQZ97_945740 [compost metagenome]
MRENQAFEGIGPLARARCAGGATGVGDRFREQPAVGVVGIRRVPASLGDQGGHWQRGVPGRGVGSLLGRTECFGARGLQAPGVVGEAGDAAGGAGLARQQASGVVGERGVAGRASRRRFALDLRDALDAVDDDVVVRRRAPNRIGHGGRAVGVVGHLREFGIVRVRGADRAAQGVVGIGGVAHA